MIMRAPTYAQSVLTWEQGWTTYYQRVRIPLELRQGIDDSVRAASVAAAESARGSLLAFAGALVSDLPWLVLIPIVAFFLLRDAGAFRGTIITALPHRIQLRGHRLFEELRS